ncbi:hypothetical protein LJE86_01915 [bacterium BMS3Abin03]|nr:hypothetical protein [bacterium BMS3Abin03]MCG6961001.1 hypothetical protein [bacterium BMS3Abin03]
MIDEELVKANKTITRLRYEENFDEDEERNKILDLLQYHLFLVHTYFDKSEFSAEDIKLKLLEKIERTDD